MSDEGTGATVAPPSQGPLPADMTRLLSQWRALADKASVRHSRACDRYHRMDSFYGVGSTVLTAIIGSTIFITLQKSTSEGVRIAAGIVGAVAAIASAIQTAGKYAKSAEEYRQASRTYSAISRQIAEIMARPPAEAQWTVTMDQLRKSLNDAGTTSPNVPFGIWRKSYPEDEVNEREADQAADPVGS